MPCARCPCKSLNNRIRCIHSRKSKATANHLRTLTNGYYLAEHTWLHNHNAAPAGATRCANPQKLLRKAQSSTRIHAAIRATSRHFDTLRPPRQDTDRIQSRASHEFMPRFDPLCACAPPAAHDAAPIRKNFCRKRKAAHEFTRHFAPLRATLILSARTDRIQSRASHEFMPRFAPLCACAPPAATTPAAFARPPVSRLPSPVSRLPSPVSRLRLPSPVSRLPSPVSRDAPRIFLPNLTKSLARALLPVNPSNRPKKASDLNPI